MPPPKLFCDKTHFIWKPNVCLIRAKNNYNLAATETTTSLFNYAKEERVLKCLSGDVKRFPGVSVSYECDSSTITPFGSQEEKQRQPWRESEKTPLPSPLPPGPLAAVLGTTLAPVLHARAEAGPGPNRMHTRSVFLSGSEYIHKETRVREET